MLKIHLSPGVVGRSLLFWAVSPGEILCSRWSLQNIALLHVGVRDRGRPPSLGTASQRDGCSVATARIAADVGHARGWRLGIYRINLLLSIPRLCNTHFPKLEIKSFIVIIFYVSIGDRLGVILKHGYFYK